MTAMVLHHSYMTQHPSFFTLISYCAIAFLFALMFTSNWFCLVQWLLVVFLLVG